MVLSPSIAEVHRAVVNCGGNKTEAARQLGVTRSLVRRRMRRVPVRELLKANLTTRSFLSSFVERERKREDDYGYPQVVPLMLTGPTLTKLKGVAISCVHNPFADPEAVAWAIDLIANEQPDVVVFLGDGVESSTAARWEDARESGVPLQEEYAANGVFLRMIRLAAPNAKLYYLPGNHEANIMAPGRLPEGVRSLVDWRRLENQPELAHWEVPTDYVYSRATGRLVLGQVVCAHGWESNAASNEMHALYLSNEYGLYIGGHTHKPKPVTQIRKGQMPLRYWYANAGCLRDLSPYYVERSRKMDWGHGAVVFEYVPLTEPKHGRYWSAETRIKCLFDEWSETHPPVAT